MRTKKAVRVIPKLKVNTIFNSIDGEVSPWYQGAFSTFVRLQGCNLRCTYCDTTYAQDDKPNYLLTPSEVADKIESFRCMKVTITGGEPLLQKDLVKSLLDILLTKGYRVTVETNGTIEPIKGYEPDVCYIVDYKLPSAGIHATQEMRDSLFLELTSFDFVKFVIGNKLDYEVAMTKYLEFLQKGCEAEFAIGIHGKEVSYKELIEWITRDGFFNLIVNVQLHKLIGVE